MYNPAGMSDALRGLFGDKTQPGVTYTPEDIHNTPIDITLPVIRIAPNDSVPKVSGGPSPGATWWANFQDSVQNGAAWVWDRATMILPSDTGPNMQPPEPVRVNSTGGNGLVLLAVAGAAFLILRKK